MLKAENVSKIFKQGGKRIYAVRNVDICLEKGQRIYIHGRSGAGKSTFLHILGGLSMPSEGQMSFYGKDIYGMSGNRRSSLRNRHFGFIFQFYHLLPELNVLENVMLPAMIKGGLPGRTARARASEILEVVGMSDRLKHRPSQLSGGEAQRTAIARALMNSPEVLFCDEPTGNLDSASSRLIYALIRDLSEKNGMSIVVVSHQEVEKDFFHSEYVMEDGVLEKINETCDMVKIKR